MDQFRNPLWLKESGSYIDIFASAFHGHDTDAIKSEIDDLANNRQKKDNLKSAKFRLEGNKLFLQAKYHSALEKYNQSLCYAENDTEKIALAYSNRSSCYLKLKLYKECLNDIEFIQKSNYPFDIKHKLDSRQAECNHILSNGNEESAPRINSQQISLSFDEHSKLAGVADCLELAHNNEWGRHIITTRDLNINDTVMIERPFSFVGHDCSDSKYNRCSHCYRALMNFIPCKNCVYSMFCNDECLEAASKSRHKVECQLAKIDISNCECNEKEFQLVLHTLCEINAAFETVEELIRTIESIIGGDGINTDGSNVKMKEIEMILQLQTNKDKQDSSDFNRSIRNALKNYEAVMKVNEFQERFASDESKRFLQHLILHLVHIAKQPVILSDLNVDVKIFREAEIRDYGMGLYPVGSILNHSCVPNVYCYSVDNRLICKVIRPIRSEEQLFRSYMCGQMIINDDETDPAIQSTYHFLKTEYKIIECKCSSCARKTSSQLHTDPWFDTKDPDYLTIRAVLQDKIEIFFRMSDEERQSYVDKSITYLNKYEKFHPIQEIFIVQMYLHNYWMITTAQDA